MSHYKQMIISKPTNCCVSISSEISILHMLKASSQLNLEGQECASLVIFLNPFALSDRDSDTVKNPRKYFSTTTTTTMIHWFNCLSFEFWGVMNWWPDRIQNRSKRWQEFLLLFRFSFSFSLSLSFSLDFVQVRGCLWGSLPFPRSSLSYLICKDLFFILLSFVFLWERVSVWKSGCVHGIPQASFFLCCLYASISHVIILPYLENTSVFRFHLDQEALISPLLPV